MRVPTAEDVDRHLNQFSRYARLVRGAARVAGLSSRLAWSHQGWIEQFKHEEAVLGMLNLVRVPPVASIPVSRGLEEALTQRPLPEPLRQAIHKAEGSTVKWVEAELTGPLAGETMGALIALKAELVRTGVVPVTAADRPKPVARPEPEPFRPSRPVKAASVRAARPAKAAKKPAGKKPSKAKKPAAKKPAARAKAKSAKPKKAGKGRR